MVGRQRLVLATWTLLLPISAGLLYVEAYGRIPFAIGLLLLPAGVALAAWVLYRFAAARRPAFLTGSLLLAVAANGAMLIVLGVRNIDAFSNRMGPFAVVVVVVGLLTALSAAIGGYLLQKTTALASWPAVAFWFALICVEVGSLNVIELVQSIVAPIGPNRG